MKGLKWESAELIRTLNRNNKAGLWEMWRSQPCEHQEGDVPGSGASQSYAPVWHGRETVSGSCMVNMQ